MKTLMLIIAALVFVVSAGCGSTVKPPITARSDPYRAEQIHYTDGELKGRTVVGDVKLHRTDAGILQAVVQMRAAIDKTFSIDYRVTFFDAAGRPIQTTGWTPKTLNANTFEYLTANSLSADAQEFQMDIRYSE